MKTDRSRDCVSTILFVCTGNLCRSPTAEGLLHAQLVREGLADRVRVKSAGTHGIVGSPASAYAISALRHMGIDIGEHRARALTQSDIDDADLVLAMTHGHISFLERHFRRTNGKLYLLSEMVGEDFDIADPYGGTEQEYAQCANQLADLIEGGFQRILALLPNVTCQ